VRTVVEEVRLASVVVAMCVDVDVLPLSRIT